MQNSMKHVFLAAIMVVLSFCATAQLKTNDTVYLNNGETHTGEIIRYHQGDKLWMRLADGTELELNDKDIRKIVQDTPYEEAVEVAGQGFKEQTEIKLRTKGLYNTTALSFALGSNNSNGIALGAGLGNVTGYLIQPWLGLGIGIGVDNYARRGETLYPIFGELRSYFLSKNDKGLYLAVAAGYGLAFERESLDIVEAEGGPMFHPALGYRLSTVEGLDVNIDVGFKYQKATFTRELFGGDVELRNLTYQRFILRAGLTLWN